MKIKAIQITAETKEAQKQLEKINLTLEQQEDLLNDIQREIESIEDLRDKTSPKDLNRIKEYNDKIKEQEKFLKRTKTRITEQRQARTKENKVVKESIKQQRDYGGVLGIIDKQTGGLISGFQGFGKSIGGATKGLKLMRVAFIATGIGAFVVLVTSLVAAFSRSEEGQEKLQVGLKMLGAVVNQVMDSFASLGEGIIEAVTNPKKALEDLGGSILKFFKNPIETTLNAVKGLKDGVVEMIDETKKEVLAIGEVTKARQKAHHIERDLQVERAEANREINDIRLKAEDRENQTAAERIVLLRKAQKIEEDITAKEIEAKQLLVDAQIKEMEQGLNTIEQKDNLAKMQAELINLDTKKLRSQRLLQTQITTALNEEKAIKEKAAADAQKVIDDDKAKADKKIEDDKAAELKRLEGIKSIKDEFEAMVAEENAVKEEEKAILEKEKAIKELEDLNATQEQKAAIIAYWDNQILIGKKKDTDAETALNKKVSDAKLDIAKRSMALIGELAGRGSKIGKAMAIGQATISGIEGVQNAYSTAQKSPITAVFPAYPFIQAGLAGAFSALQIKKIASTKADGKGATPSPTVSGGGGGGAPAMPSAPPAFNVVGQGGTSQLANAIGGQANQPTRAYVVSNDVTTAQGLERNIVEGATI
tara:strand:+ start:196 stop:2145 length:1950 start_codon:yes stop_codon:yes gene_type:complete